ncbi:MAG: right-handed parallel beta-helix repeat-containing protein, partial [Bacteroidetes bacterium]|nr:right-handed parallel beta-helix repeat-containing protein [Bacteroidota bacterium]
KENLKFSIDTLVFDTVFTTVGSTTLNFKFYNPSRQSLKVDEIELMGGASSPFRMNVDGVKSRFVRDVEMEGEDSLFVFVEVTLSVNNGVLPMIIEDKIRFRTNGKDQFVQLAVWGQDAYFHRNDLNEGIWPNDKPHVIYGFAAVDSAKSLTIQAGTDIFLHKNSLLYNYKGTLLIQGTKENKVTLQGDRLEALYDKASGQYYGIYFQEARPSVIEHLEMKNAIAGIHLFSRNTTFNDYTLTLRNSEIYNSSRYGVFIYSGARVKAENTALHGNGLHALLVLEGGAFNFNYCNLLNYFGASQSPAVGISNYFLNSATGNLNIGEITEGTITNSVVYGNLETELAIDTMEFNGQKLWQFNFSNCVIAKKENLTASYYTNIQWNKNPFFFDVFNRDFNYLESSPLSNAASSMYYLPTDFIGVARHPSTSDIGFLEKP